MVFGVRPNQVFAPQAIEDHRVQVTVRIHEIARVQARAMHRSSNKMLSIAFEHQIAENQAVTVAYHVERRCPRHKIHKITYSSRSRDRDT